MLFNSIYHLTSVILNKSGINIAVVIMRINAIQFMSIIRQVLKILYLGFSKRMALIFSEICINVCLFLLLITACEEDKKGHSLFQQTEKIFHN